MNGWVRFMWISGGMLFSGVGIYTIVVGVLMFLTGVGFLEAPK